MLKALTSKIKKEIKKVCKLDHNCILRDGIEGVKQFSWETVWLELQRNVPTLCSLLAKLLYQPSKPLICFIISQIIKQHLPCMALVQREISILLYGNGTSKQVIVFMWHIVWYWHTYIGFMQVYNCLHRLMVCLSYSATTNLIRKLSEDHNADVLYWSDDLKKLIPVSS